jgi:hypothetical protein
MADINLSQLLGNAAAFLTCGALLGAFFAWYVKRVGGDEIDAKLLAFEKTRLHPALDDMKAQLREVAAISGRLKAVETSLSDLGDAVKDQAKQHRSDLTGLGTRLENAQNNQTALLLKVIEAGK